MMSWDKYWWQEFKSYCANWGTHTRNNYGSGYRWIQIGPIRYQWELRKSV